MNIIETQLIKLRDKKRARINVWFFKTGKGEYGENDRFLGVRLPQIRKIIKACLKESKLEDVIQLLKSPWHEARLAGCILMVELRKKTAKNGDIKEEEKIYRIYLKNIKRVNNWDLVDISAREIIGNHLIGKDKDILYALSKSKSLWERRIAVVSTWAFIKNSGPKETFLICKELLKDKHDLIRKACGWMLREAGKNCGLATLNAFLDKYACDMPRVMLRYALEKHGKAERKKYMNLSPKNDKINS